MQSVFLTKRAIHERYDLKVTAINTTSPWLTLNSQLFAL
jgi:hypothetical protein